MATENKYSTTEMFLKATMKAVNQTVEGDTNGKMVHITKDNLKEVIEMDRVYYTKPMVLFTKVIILLRK